MRRCFILGPNCVDERGIARDEQRDSRDTRGPPRSLVVVLVVFDNFDSAVIVVHM